MKNRVRAMAKGKRAKGIMNDTREMCGVDENTVRDWGGKERYEWRLTPTPRAIKATMVKKENNIGEGPGLIDHRSCRERVSNGLCLCLQRSSAQLPHGGRPLTTALRRSTTDRTRRPRRRRPNGGPGAR